jgi:transcriptional regulator with XRE-family HTH domain
MRTAVKRSYRYSPEDTAEWLRTRMDALKISGLEELHQRTGIDRGSLSRYFRQERVPKIDVIGPLCEALEVSPETLLVALGAIERKSKS